MGRRPKCPHCGNTDRATLLDNGYRGADLSFCCVAEVGQVGSSFIDLPEQERPTKCGMQWDGTYAGVIVWRWDRKRLLWEAMLTDGTILRAVMIRRRNRRVGWQPETVFAVSADHTRTADQNQAYETADLAQQAAFDYWKHCMARKAKTLKGSAPP